jgi:putative FmdB family regulatory protein
LALRLTECQGSHTRSIMPTYEYACAACGHAWEQTQRITEPPIELCPKCARTSAHRLISAGTNFILKGGGWYSDLYASPKAPAKKAEDGSAPAASGTEAASTSTESKPSDGKAASPAAAPAAPSKASTPASPVTPPATSS